MVISVDLRSASVVLTEESDFGSLEAAVRGERDEPGLLQVLGARAAPDDHIWLPAASIASWAPDPTAGWIDAFRSMLRKVEPYGWYDASADAVKVHVEWDVAAEGADDGATPGPA